MGTEHTYCTFQLCDLYLGINVMQVQEVLRAQGRTRVPLASDVIQGLINLRGQIVMAIDLRRRLGLPARGEEESPMNVIVHTEDGPVSFLVDAIGDVIEIDDNAMEPAPITMDGQTRALLQGVCKLPRHLMLVLDPERVAALDHHPSSP